MYKSEWYCQKHGHNWQLASGFTITLPDITLPANSATFEPHSMFTLLRYEFADMWYDHVCF